MTEGMFCRTLLQQASHLTVVGLDHVRLSRKDAEDEFSQPFLRDATSTDFAAYPQYCYDKAWSGQSYAENPNLSAYHIFDVTAWMAAAGVSAS
ncbi:hypothetical protein, partial [Klebsiella pneumoniae]|uniref:hypothetical protein n=1 Tax=Klebsiella pneumoniae TaxID=573 RepID=UPI001C42F776